MQDFELEFQQLAKPDKPGLYLYLTEISGLPDVLLVHVTIKDGKYRFNPEHSIDYSEESWLDCFGYDKWIYIQPILDCAYGVSHNERK